MSPTFQALGIRNYRIYATGSVISNVGTWLQTTAQAWLVLELTGSGAALGLMVALQLAPTLLFSPFAGVLADRFPKRRLLQWAQLGMAVPSAAMSVLAVTDRIVLWEIYVLAFVFGTARAFEAPARQSFPVEMVGPEDLANAVALNSASFNVGRLVGPALAGVMIALLGSGVTATGWVIGLNALSYVAVLLSLWRLDLSALRPMHQAGSRRGAVRDGVRYVRSRPDLMLLLSGVFCIGAFGMNFQITNALMVTEEFGHGAGEYGLLGSLLAIGSLSGALLAARRKKPRLRYFVVAALAFACLQVLSGLAPVIAVYAGILPFIGLATLTAATTANATIQMTSAPEMRGRVAALYVMVFMGSVPFGSPVVGAIAEGLGPRWALVFSGLLVGGGVLLAAWRFGSVVGLGRAELRTAAADLRWKNARRAHLHGVETP